MSERFRDSSENEANVTPHEELLDGPQPGFRRLTDEGKEALEEEDKAVFNTLADNFGGDPERDIDEHIILTED